MESNLLEMPYGDKSVAFTFANTELMVNATDMCRIFEKRPNDFLALPSTAAYKGALARRLTAQSDTRKSGITPVLVTTAKGRWSDGKGQGTWFHRLLGLELARWLSPDFSVACNEFILEVMERRDAPADSLLLESPVLPSKRKCIPEFFFDTGMSDPSDLMSFGKFAKSYALAIGCSPETAAYPEYGPMHTFAIKVLDDAFGIWRTPRKVERWEAAEVFRN